MNGDNVVLFDGYCSFCRAAQRAVDRLDWLRLLKWLPFQADGADRFGIPVEALQERMYLVSGANRRSGFAAWKQILLRLPVTYALIAATGLANPYALVAWVLFFLPLTEPIGERVYDWVARNRYRLPGSTCEFEP